LLLRAAQELIYSGFLEGTPEEECEAEEKRLFFSIQG
jgi:hypothetical protein